MYPFCSILKRPDWTSVVVVPIKFTKLLLIAGGRRGFGTARALGAQVEGCSPVVLLIATLITQIGPVVAGSALGNNPFAGGIGHNFRGACLNYRPSAPINIGPLSLVVMAVAIKHIVIGAPGRQDLGCSSGRVESPPESGCYIAGQGPACCWR